MNRFRSGYLLTATFLSAVILSTALAASGQRKVFDIEQVREAFKAAAAEHFEVLGDELAGLESEKRPGAYWLARVKPKKPGHYAIKFTFKYNDPSYDEGEYSLYVRVGGKICDRQPQVEAGIARFCLGDTVILPVRAANRYDYSFEVKYTAEIPYSIPQKPSATAEIDAEKIPNPLGSNLKFLGTRRVEQLHRSANGSTVTYYAMFEALRPGRFNIAVSRAGGGTPSEKSTLPPGSGTPVIILEPGDLITYLAGREDTIDYSDNKRFSSHGGGTFPTNLLLLRPGDIIELAFLTIRGDDTPAETSKTASLQTPLIQSAPFRVRKDWSYNAFIADYFPAGK